MTFFEEFRNFAVKGNAVDMAVGIIIGTAFNNVVNSLVNDIFMPPLGFLISGVDFKDMQLVIHDPLPHHLSTISIRYGAFINSLVQFLIIAFSVFMVVKLMNFLINRREEAEKKKP